MALGASYHDRRLTLFRWKSLRLASHRSRQHVGSNALTSILSCLSCSWVTYAHRVLFPRIILFGLQMRTGCPSGEFVRSKCMPWWCCNTWFRPTYVHTWPSAMLWETWRRTTGMRSLLHWPCGSCALGSPRHLVSAWEIAQVCTSRSTFSSWSHRWVHLSSLASTSCRKKRL